MHSQRFFFFLIARVYSMANKIMKNHSTSKDATTLNEVLYHNIEKTHQTTLHIKAFLKGNK